MALDVGTFGCGRFARRWSNLLLIGDRKEIIMMMPRPDKNGKNSGYYTAVCIGAKRHYGKSGGCKHTPTTGLPVRTREALPRWATQERI